MKDLVLIEQGSFINHPITIEKHSQLKNNNIDIIRLNWKHNKDPNAHYTLLDFNGKIPRWSEGKEFLISKAIDKYKFIMYTDEDICIKSFDEKKDPWQILLKFLKEWNPIAANINTKGVWSYDKRVINKVSNNKNCVIMHHDACNFIIRNDMCKLLHPIEFHGSDKIMWYQQYLCHMLRREHYISPAGLIAFNKINDEHHYSDSRHPAYTNKVLKGFSEKLKDPKDFLKRYCKHRSATNPELLKLDPQKNAPAITADELNTLFVDKV